MVTLEDFVADSRTQKPDQKAVKKPNKHVINSTAKSP